MENKFSIGGRDFQLSKMDTFKQFHVVRRVGPILADLVPNLAKSASKKENLSEEEKLDMAGKFAGPVMNGLAKLSDADSEMVLHSLLSCVEAKTETGHWAKVSSNGMLMMQNLDLPVLLQLAGRAFVFNLSGFFSALPAK